MLELAGTNPSLEAPTFITIGPSGTDHERVVYRYIEFQGLSSFTQVDLMGNQSLASDGPARVLEEPKSFLVLCSAHLKVSNVTEEFPQEVVVIDDFRDATKDLSLVVRRDVTNPKSLGLVEATNGYNRGEIDWETVDDQVSSKPELSERLLAGEFDAGITFTALADEYPELFRIEKRYGKVLTNWLVFGQVRYSRYAGELIGHKITEVYTGETAQ